MEKCKVARYCGGCQYQGLDYQKQLAEKQKNEEKLFSSFGKVLPIIGMNDPYHYRNKVQVSFGYDEEHRVICGNYVNSTHFIVPIEDCQICDETANSIISSLKRLIIRYRISVFDEKSMKGCIRHALVRCSNDGQYMLVLVTGSFNIKDGDLLVKDLLKYNPQLTTVVQNINNRHTSMILGDKSKLLYGRGYIVDELCDLKFRISAASFYQVNKRQTSVLYKEAIEKATLNKRDVVIDAYCGTGTIGMIAAKYVKKVIGVELNSYAVKDAEINKKENGINNIEFYCDDATRFMMKMAKNHLPVDVVIMDPPRSGADQKFIEAVFALKPRLVIYISCNPLTLKTNLDQFKRNYHIDSIQPVDMFPFTSHVETVVLMSRDGK